MRKLTKEEQSFAAKFHNLLHEFLHKNQLDEDELYDVAVFGYLHAVSLYHDREDLQRYNFTTIAWHCMKSSCGNYRRAQFRFVRRANWNAARLDAPINPFTTITLGNILAASTNIELEVERRNAF